MRYIHEEEHQKFNINNANKSKNDRSMSTYNIYTIMLYIVYL